MKKLLLLAVLTTILTGCYVSKSAYDMLYYTDFTKYAQDGFFVSSITDYTGVHYVALGNISIASYPNITTNYDEQKLIDKLVAEAKKKGANGVIGYSVKHIPGSEHTREYWFASGVAVYFEKLPTLPAPSAKNQTVDLPKKYNFEKARKDAHIKEKPLIATVKNNGYPSIVYYDPETGRYDYRNEFEKKYGYNVIPELEKENK